jgi:hypothetical protein
LQITIFYIATSKVYIDTFDGGVTIFSATATGTTGASTATEVMAVIIVYYKIELLSHYSVHYGTFTYIFYNATAVMAVVIVY